MEIYRQMYKEAEPSLDFDIALSTGITAKPDWFMNYYLCMERQVEIVDTICKKYRCDRNERRAINHEIWLGSSPNSCKEI